MKTMTEEVRRYLEAVEVELSDLSAEERTELLSDVEEHLTDVAAENAGSFEERLGDPSSYANELRTSAGFPPRTLTESSERRWRSLLKRVASDKRVRSARALLTEIEPGWWVLRGYLVVALVGDMSRSDFPFPRINGNQFLGLLGIAGSVWGSLALGRLARRSRVAAVASVVASALVALATLATFADARSGSVAYEQESGPPPAGVRHGDGSEALNLCPYGADGELLSRVLLFDQAGRPLTEVPRIPGSRGDEVMNAYPRDLRVPSADGVLRDAPCPVLAKVKIGTTDQPSWIEAMVGGAPVFRALLEPGQTRTFFGEQIVLVVGNAGAVNIRANGKLLGKPGAIGEVYRGVFDAETKRLPSVFVAP
jgi:hypothetical protein